MKRALSLNSGTRLQRILVGASLGLLAIYCDTIAHERDRALLQAFLLSAGILALLLVELRWTLTRWRQALVFVVLFGFHFYLLHLEWHRFPFDSSLSVIFLMLAETILFGLVYIRVCQSFDPQGPFGPTDEERKLRRMHPHL